MFNFGSLTTSFAKGVSMRHPCPECRGTMKLLCIETHSPTNDLRTFQCGECSHLASVLVVSDPMASTANRWAFSHLYPPK